MVVWRPFYSLYQAQVKILMLLFCLFVLLKEHDLTEEALLTIC